MGKPFALSFSGGKDSMLALHRLVRAGYPPAALVTAFDEKRGRSWFHGIPARVLSRLSEALGIPLVMAPCGEGEAYNRAFAQALRRLSAQGVPACAFGDIDLAPHREWDEARCAEAGMEALLPLWGQEREALAGEFLSLGYTAILKAVKLRALPEEYLGRPLSLEVFRRLRQAGADICGENGEYHTLVVDGPLFRFRVSPEISGTVREGDRAFLELAGE